MGGTLDENFNIDDTDEMTGISHKLLQKVEPNKNDIRNIDTINNLKRN